MEKRSCGLCGRRFASGRALGGHMRSHMLFAKAPILPSSEMDGPKKSADPEFSIGGESEAESSIVPSLPSPCASDATTEVDVARCLMMLSRDTWREGSENGRGARRRRRREEEAPVEARSGYQCDTCKRVFRSYHALGGHRAGHKKMRTSCVRSSAQIQMHSTSGDNIHDCAICYRVFSSAQALGGHKRSHLYPSASALKRDGTFIDLNLPPVVAEDVELSSVSETKVAFMWR